MIGKGLAYGFVSILLVLTVGCGNKDPKYSDTPTAGEITIAVDEAYKPIIETEMDTFHAFYKYAKVNVRYVPEGEAFRLLLADSVRLIIANRDLTKEERTVFETIKITPRVTPIATDALALICHPTQTDTLASLLKIKDILTGKLNKWKSNNADIIPVFVNNASSSFRYTMDTLKISKNEISNTLAAASSHEEVINYVKKNPGALGFIGVSWISDGDDPKTLQFIDGLRVISLAPKDTIPEEYYPPFQYAIALRSYPLCRSVKVISREARTGLGTGLTAFLASDKGQRIILKAGLLPANAPIRVVKLKQ